MPRIQKATGLALDTSGQQYLAQVYGMQLKETVAGLPVFENAQGDLHVGGYKGFYTIAPNALSKEVIEAWRGNRVGVHYNFSHPRKLFSGSRLDMVLTLPPDLAIEGRFALYERNVRKHIHRVESSSMAYIVEPPPENWYDLYVRHCERLGSAPHTLDRYKAIEKHMGDKVICMSAYDQDALVGVLYCVRAADYINLLVIASDTSYRPMRIDNGLYDAAIRYAIRERISTVDFGPTMAKDESHWRIKADYGAQPYFFADRSFVPLRNHLVAVASYNLSRVRSRLRRYLGKAIIRR